jgi:Holliday junction resolvasome RuvABC DNA-binding subunit
VVRLDVSMIIGCDYVDKFEVMEALIMDEKRNNTRREKVVNSILDAGVEDIQKIGVETTHAIIQEVKEWVINKYSKVKSSSDDDGKIKLEDLEMRIKISNENVDIGMEKKEIAIMWAMRKLGYSEEQTQQVLDLANKAYQKKE